MAEFDYQWKHTLKEEYLENEEDKFECNEKRVKEFLNQFKKYFPVPKYPTLNFMCSEFKTIFFRII